MTGFISGLLSAEEAITADLIPVVYHVAVSIYVLEIASSVHLAAHRGQRYLVTMVGHLQLQVFLRR